MSELKIGRTELPVEALKPLKESLALNEDLKAKLQNDGLDEIIFKKGDQLYIAYKNNLDLHSLKVNSDAFNAYTSGNSDQLFMDGVPVQVLFKDDEDTGSFWLQPYRALAGALDKPWSKAGLISLGAGAIAGVFVRSPWGLEGSYDRFPTTLAKGTFIGTSIAAEASTLRFMAETWNAGTEYQITYTNGSKGTEKTKPSAGVFFAGHIGYGLGILAGIGGYEGIKGLIKNPTVAVGVGVSLATGVGLGLAVDALSDSRKVPNYMVINDITK